MIKRTLLLSAAALVTLNGAALAEETKVRTEVITEVQDLPNVNKVNFSAFDTNADGVYSMAEVGGRLFESFDQDDNGTIDNIEWDSRTVMTITPIEQETFQYIDEGNDGTTDAMTYSYQTFYEESGLMRFDDNKNGLSAEEFIQSEFQALDKNDDNLIQKDEWQTAYIESRTSSAFNKEYNQ